MIKINTSDTLIDIVNKISICNDKVIILDFPFGHQILHSYLSLKIIKNKCQLKDLTIITNDINAKKIGSRIGIKYSIIDNDTPINKQNILKENFTTYTYLKYLFKKYKEEIVDLFNKNTEIEQLGIDNIIRNTKTRIGFFLTILFISIFIFIFIFYFAVNKTIITITPETIIKLRSVNIIFTERKDNPSYVKNIVNIRKINNITKLNEVYGTSGVKRNNNKKSSGTVTIFNTLKEDIELIKNTRLETSEGIIYKILSNTRINKAHTNSGGKIIPGKKDITIEAKEFDINGKIIGENGNIKKGIKLTIPGLKDNKKNIYAITKTSITGGSDEYQKILTEEDIKNSKKLFEYKLKQNAIKEIKEIIALKNKENNITSVMLGIDNIVKYTDLKIETLGNIKVGDKINNLSLSGTINIHTYTYNKNTVINKMKTKINDSILEGDEKITFINDNSIRISNIIYQKDRPYELKATVEIEVFLSHNFNNSENYYVENLKDEIVGLDKNEALKILLNNNKISEVDIDIRPFFINKISNIANNIEFKLNE